MKAEKIFKLFDWCEDKVIDSDGWEEALSMFRQVSEEVLDGLLGFDAVEDWWWQDIVCTVYKNIKGKEWYSCVVNWSCKWYFKNEKQFVKYIVQLYDRAMEILDN